jgi:hypothetical protein
MRVRFVCEFVAFRTLHEAMPFTEGADDLVCRCLEYYLVHSGKSVDVVERFLAKYKIELCELDEQQRKEKTR